ncbi:MAG TPA: FecR domain-containing protein [Niastella sp.]|nr:FecR domain-containing protein [Niastella sp.]
MQTNNFQELLDKYLTGTLTETERNRFYELLNDPEHNKQLAAIIDKELYEHQFESEPDNNILAAIQENIQSGIQAEKAKRAKIIRLTRWLTVAAVVIIGFCGVAWWWLTAENPTQNEIVEQKPVNGKNAITPGGNKAILKLSDGREIVLDSAGEGTLTKQGQSNVIKSGDGQLQYQAAGNTSAETVYNTIATPRGGQYQLVMADGSKVWLNASSSLRFPTAFTGKERRVELTGEGYFEIQHLAPKGEQKKIPFIVNVISGNGREAEVEVLGTHFNINAYDDEMAVKTTLLNGSVKVKAENLVVLKPGEQAALAGAHSPLTIDHSPDLEQVMAWKNGLFQFKAAGIETVLRQAARWYDVTFVYKGTIPERFSGQISRSANAEQLLKILELTGKVKFEINGKTIIVKQ